MHRAIVTTLAIACLSGAVQAAEPEVCPMTGPMRPTTLAEAKSNRDCEKSNLGQQELNECQLYLLVLSQAALTEAHNRAVPAVEKFERPAMDQAKGDLKASFLKAEQAWCAYREASCDFDAGSLEGGSMQPEISFLCRRRRNEAHIKALDTLATCESGGDCQTPPLFYMYELFSNEAP